MSFRPGGAPRISTNAVPLSVGQSFNINLQFGPEWERFLRGSQEAQVNFIFDAFDPGLGRVGEFLHNDMIQRMHLLTGKMRATTTLSKVSVLRYVHSVPVPYAGAENRRPGVKGGFGPHNFWEPAIQTTIMRAIPMLIDELIRYIVSHFGGPRI